MPKILRRKPFSFPARSPVGKKSGSAASLEVSPSTSTSSILAAANVGERSLRSSFYRAGRLRVVAVFFDGPGLHVIDVAGFQDVIGFLPWLVMPGVVMDCHFPFSHYFETISGDDDGGAFGQADAQ